MSHCFEPKRSNGFQTCRVELERIKIGSAFMNMTSFIDSVYLFVRHELYSDKRCKSPQKYG